MNNRLLMVTPSQYGYNTDAFQLSKWVSEKYKITFVCVDCGLAKQKSENIDVHYVEEGSGGLNLVKESIRIGRTGNIDVFFVVWFPLAFLIPLLCQKGGKILDIRTGYISNNKVKRLIGNSVIKFTTLFYKTVSIITSDLARRLSIKSKKIRLLPLGADKSKELEEKDYKTFHLIYVGVLSGRRIDETIDGFHQFRLENKEHENSTYTIVGYFGENDEEQRKRFELSLNTDEQTTWLGRIPQSKLGPFLKNANVGVSYIPMTPWFDIQPPTKTYEYLLNGLACVATATKANKEILSGKNGILHSDNAESFKDALVKLIQLRTMLNTREIAESVDQFSWENISKQYFLPLLSEASKINVG